MVLSRGFLLYGDAEVAPWAGSLAISEQREGQWRDNSCPGSVTGRISLFGA